MNNNNIPDTDIETFLKNSQYLTVFDFKPYHEELANPVDVEIDIDYNDQGE